MSGEINEGMPLIERIELSIKRITSGHGQMRVPPDATDPDLVLADCLSEITNLSTLLLQAREALEEWRSEFPGPAECQCKKCLASAAIDEGVKPS